MDEEEVETGRLTCSVAQLVQRIEASLMEEATSM